MCNLRPLKCWGEEAGEVGRPSVSAGPGLRLGFMLMLMESREGHG